jgi:DNA-directed RNA polymerase specialized sigma24 family protein
MCAEPRHAQFDETILGAAAAGDLQLAARLILEHHGPRLGRILERLLPDADVDDVLQETVLDALDALRAGRFRGESSLSLYLGGVARHKALRARRSFWHLLFRRRSVGSEALAHLADPGPDVHATGVVPLAPLLAHLSPREGLVVRLRLARRPFRDIGDAMGVSEDNAAQIHHRAVAKLRRAVGR